MKFNQSYFPTWLDQVRDKLLSLSIAGNRTRIYLFKSDLVLDEQYWRCYFDEGMMPWQAVNEDMELPYYEIKQHRIL